VCPRLKVWHPRCAWRKRNIMYVVRRNTTFIIAERIAATCFGRIYQIHTAWWWQLLGAETCSCYWFCYNKSCVLTEYVHTNYCVYGVTLPHFCCDCLWNVTMCHYYDVLVCDAVQFGRSSTSQHSLFYREDAGSSRIMSQYGMFTFLVSATGWTAVFRFPEKVKIFLSSLQNK
jgi:hypothetical protein